jgi:putative transcriptional regulator
LSGGEHNIGDPAELAALYLAGGLDADERDAFEAHLAEGCAACDRELLALDSVCASLAGAVEPVMPSNLARIAVLARAAESLGELSPQQADGVAALVSAIGESVTEILEAARTWAPTVVEGTFLHRLDLEADDRRLRALVRMEPGVRFPAHTHNEAEQCIVLYGDLSFGEERFTAGEYRYWKPGEPQPVQTTEQGCLLLVSSPLD